MAPPDLSNEEIKKLFKEALKEWMDEKFTDFGKWSAAAISAAVLAAFMYFVFWVEGLKK